MKKAWVLFIVAILLALILSGCEPLYRIRNLFRFGERDQFNYGVTAMQWFTYINKAAVDWRPDAYFYGISEAPVGRDGSSDKWVYLFYSPGIEKQATITYEAGFISTKEVVAPPLNPIEKVTVDSPAALNIANLNGANDFYKNNNNVSIAMSLAGPILGSSKGKHNPCWTIRFYGDTQSLAFVIDASNGNVVTKQ